MSQAPATEQQMSTVIVVDAPAAVQTWMDQLSAQFPDGLGLLNHPHPNRTMCVSLSHLWRAVEESFPGDDGGSWSIATNGLPPIPVLPDRSAPPPPNAGSLLHNLWHALGG